VGAGYTRQAQDNIVDGAVIDSDDLNAEFNQVEAAFNSTTGHTHDGTEGEGPQIDTAGLADDAVTGAKIDSTTTVTAASFVGPLTGDVTGNADTATALTGVTASDAELNILDGATISTTELNYLDGVTSNIQTQLDESGGTTENSTNQYAIPIYATAGGDVLEDSVENTYARIQSNGYVRADSNNVILASYASGTPTIATTTSATDNVIVGIDAGKNLSSGDNNVVIGQNAGLNVTSEDNAVYVGSEAGLNATNGSINVAIGYRAGLSIVGPSTHNTYVGHNCGGSVIVTNTDPNTYNTGVGAYALSDIEAGLANTGIGAFSVTNITTGEDNTGVGRSAGVSIVSGDNNLCLGHNAGNFSSPFDFPLGSESNRVVVGNNDITNAYVAVNWSVTSDERDKTELTDLDLGLDFLNLVEPKTFYFDRRSKYYVYDDNDVDGSTVIAKPDPDGTHKSDKKFVGFSAQQVQEAVEQAGFPDQIIIDTSDPENYKMKETAFIPALVKAVQELSARVEQLEAQLNSQ